MLNRLVHSGRRVWHNTLLLAALLTAVSAASQTLPPDVIVSTEVLVHTGQASPDGNGVFSNQFTPPLLNNSGQTLFVAEMLATTNPGSIDDLGLYRASRDRVDTMARGGQLSAAGNELDLFILQLLSLQRRQLMGLGHNGEAAFVATDSENEDAIYRSDGASLATVLQAGQNAPFGDNLSLGAAVLGFLMNDAGQLAYLVDSNTQNLLVRSEGLFTEAVFGTGQPLPGSNTLTGLRTFAFSNSGEVIARLNTSSDSFGHFVGDPTGVRMINQTGAAAPDGLGTFITDPRLPAAINGNSETAVVTGVDDIATDYVGLYLDQGAGLVEITRTGDATFGGDLLALVSGLKLNDNGDLLYSMASSGNNQIQRLVLRRDGADLLVASQGDLLVPEEQAVLAGFFGFTLNELGQVLFSAGVSLPDLPPATGLYLFDPLAGLIEIVRTGQPLSSGNIASIGMGLPPLFPLETNTIGNAQTGFNDASQVAFSFTLDNGFGGVALASVSFVSPDVLFKDGFESILP